VLPVFRSAARILYIGIPNENLNGEMGVGSSVVKPIGKGEKFS
jgi:hypothetical protein